MLLHNNILLLILAPGANPPPGRSCDIADIFCLCNCTIDA